MSPQVRPERCVFLLETVEATGDLEYFVPEAAIFRNEGIDFFPQLPHVALLVSSILHRGHLLSFQHQVQIMQLIILFLQILDLSPHFLILLAPMHCLILSPLRHSLLSFQHIFELLQLVLKLSILLLKSLSIFDFGVSFLLEPPVLKYELVFVAGEFKDLHR